MSAYTFMNNNLLNRHSLKATLVSVHPQKDSLEGTILFVNSGRSHETIYSGSFIFADDLNDGGGFVSHETIGPIVIAPKQAIIVKLKTATGNIVSYMRESKNSDSLAIIRIHTGFIFNVIGPQGDLPEGGIIYKFAELQFDAGGQSVGARPLEGDHDGLIDLL